MVRIIYTLLVVLLFALVSCAPKGVVHVVQPGQTLYRISKTYHVPVDKLISSNRIKDGSHINAGDALWIPGASRTRTVSVLPNSSSSKHKPVVPPKKRSTLSRTTQSSPVSVKKKITRASTSAKKGQFLWPVNGSVVTSFDLTSRTPSKGIDIAAQVSTPIKSAAAGKVIYSGNGITGYGHVVIVEHDHNLFTVYGYSTKTLVSLGSYVNSGQAIALVGSPPGMKSGRLHFEVWRNKKAVNPKLYLP